VGEAEIVLRVPERFDSQRIDAALDALADRERLREAESLVATAAPRLQRVLTEAMDAGGWFEEAHLAEVQRAATVEEPAERVTAVRTLLAEEARMGMMVGVAVGWALFEELAEQED